MFNFTRRTTTVTLLAVASLSSAIGASPAAAAPAPVQRTIIAVAEPTQVALLLPAVQAAREAARR